MQTYYKARTHTCITEPLQTTEPQMIIGEIEEACLKSNIPIGKQHYAEEEKFS